MAGAQATPSDSSARAILAAGDAAWTRGARDSAYALYRSAVRRDSAAAAAALVRLATMETERRRFDPAAALLRAYLRVEPGDEDARVALARVLAWSGRYEESIVLYDSVLAHDSTQHDAALGRALALSWAKRFDRAEHAFASVLARQASPDAERGLARIATWRGDLADGERRWRSLTMRFPADIENWMGLAQVQRAAGRPMAADSALRRALALDPSSADARDQLYSVRAASSLAAEPALAHTSDSDGNRATSLAVTLHSRSLGPVLWRVTGTLRDAVLPSVEGTSAGARGRVAWSTADARFLAAAEAGATRLSARAGGSATSQVVGSALAQVMAATRSGTRMALTASRAAFDETAALIAAGIITTALEFDATVAGPGRIGVDISTGRTTLSGGNTPNARTALSANIRWRARPGLSLSATARGMACDTTGRDDGYFCPDGFRLLEAGALGSIGAEHPWGATLDAGLGRQSVRGVAADPWRSTTAARVRTALRFRPVAGYELEVAYGLSTAASPFTRDAADYSARVFSLRARLRL